MARTEFLQIRLTPEDRRRLENAAEAEFLDLSTWARQILLRAVQGLPEPRDAVKKGKASK